MAYTAIDDPTDYFRTKLYNGNNNIQNIAWDETDTSGQVALAVGSSVTLKFYPEGAVSGDTYYSGTALVTGKNITASFDGMVEASISVQGTGAITTATV